MHGVCEDVFVYVWGCVCMCEWCTLPWPAAFTAVPEAAVGFNDDEMVLWVFSSVSLLNDAHKSSILDFSFSSWEASPPSPPSQASLSSPPSPASPASPASPVTSTGLLSFCLVERCDLLWLLINKISQINLLFSLFCYSASSIVKNSTVPHWK